MTEQNITPEYIIAVKAELEENASRETIENLVKTRKALIANKIVTTSTGKKFDADEQSILRLCNAVIRNLPKPDTHIISWSTADVGTGVMVPCTKAEIVEAHQLATDFFGEVWGA